MARDAGIIQRADNEVAAQAVLLAHPLHAPLSALKRLQRGLLRHDRGAENGVLVDLHHRLDDVGGTAGIADPPTGHRKGLRESMKKDSPLLHPGQCRDGVVGHLVVGEFAVDLVGQHNEIVLHRKGGDLPQLLQRQDRSGGIGREVQHQDAGLVRDRLLQGVRAERELLLGTGGHGHGNAASQQDAGAVGDIAGLVVEDLVAGIEQGAERDVDGLGDTHGDDDFVVGVVGDGEMLLDVGGDRPAKARRAEIGRIAGVSLFERIDRRLADVPRGDKIRLADPQRDDLLHRLDDLKEVADSRTGNGADMVRDA